VVIEDAPPGVRAGKAAGMRVVAVAATHAPADLGAADAVAAGLGAVRVEAAGDGLRVSVED
jgi:sugar-phosphatase